MDFAKKQLEKYGWTDGKGLGKNEDGISEALKPRLKFDNAGIGHDVADQFTNNWWERVFNSAANNINVHVEKDDIKLRLKSESVEISTKNYSIRELHKNKNFAYGSFLKSSKLTESGVQSYNVDLPEPILAIASLTDEELFAACGGRTAHKGARHGLKLSGKLSRIEKQERMLLKKMKNVSLTDDQKVLEKKMKKLKKHKEETSNDLPVETPEIQSSPSSKKTKNKRKSVSFSEQTVVKYYTPDLDTVPDGVSDENSNNSTISDANSNDEGIEQDIDDNGSEQSDGHKSFEEAQTTFDDLSRAERKKLKKKRKLEKKKNATSQFIEEVREQMAIEDICKKRKLVSEELELCKHSKKEKNVPEKKMRKKERREKKMMNKIVESLDHCCKISDDE